MNPTVSPNIGNSEKSWNKWKEYTCSESLTFYKNGGGGSHHFSPPSFSSLHLVTSPPCILGRVELGLIGLPLLSLEPESKVISEILGVLKVFWNSNQNRNPNNALFFQGKSLKIATHLLLVWSPSKGWFNDPCDTVATSRKWVPYQDKDTSLTGHLPLNQLELFEGETFWCHHPSFILLVDTPPGSASTNSGCRGKVHVGGRALSKVLNQNVRGQNL